jgi:hypothetical protein
MIPFENHKTTIPRKDATMGAVHPSRTKSMVELSAQSYIY